MLEDTHNQGKFDAMISGLGKGHEDFMLNPLPHLQQAGIPLLPAASVSPEAQIAIAGVAQSMNLPMAAAAAPQAAGEKITASVHWWGVDLVMNEKMTQDIITGVALGGPLAAAIASAFGALGIITGGIATALGAGVGAIVAMKVAQIKITNNGKGVHWPISWVQWAALLAAVPTGPAGIAAVGVVFFHPVRN